jgi:hypothetical protein
LEKGVAVSPEQAAAFTQPMREAGEVQRTNIIDTGGKGSVTLEPFYTGPVPEYNPNH